jgi:hypothetical protein
LGIAPKYRGMNGGYRALASGDAESSARPSIAAIRRVFSRAYVSIGVPLKEAMLAFGVNMSGDFDRRAPQVNIEDSSLSFCDIQMRRF